MDTLIILLFILVMGIVQWRDYKQSPECHWCQSRHRGRCIFNPRAGRVFANTRDGHFDYNDPNQ